MGESGREWEEEWEEECEEEWTRLGFGVVYAATRKYRGEERRGEETRCI